jgi:hypothetical protein
MTDAPKTRSISDHIVLVPFAIVPSEASLDSRLTLMQLRVLIAILSWRRKNTDSVCVRREQIAERCNYEPQTISKVTTQLVGLGWLEKIGKGGFSKACEYRVTVPDLGTVDESDAVSEPGTVPESGTVPEVDPTTVSEPGEIRCPNRPHAINRVTEKRTEVSSAGASSTPAFGVITAGWQPPDDCVRMLEQRGVTRSFVEDAIPEFILYWRERGRAYHAAEWPGKFLGHVKRQWERYQAALNNPNAIPRPIDPNFWPIPETERELALAGMSPEALAQHVAEFRRYWIERAEPRHAWNAKFHEWALQRCRPAAEGNILDKLNDRSWAEEALQK